MSNIGTGYDLSVTTFSTDGRVFQVEYAAKAVDNSGRNVEFFYGPWDCGWDPMQGWDRPGRGEVDHVEDDDGGSNRRIHSVHRHAGMLAGSDPRGGAVVLFVQGCPDK